VSRVLYDCKLKAVRNLTPTLRELTVEFVNPTGFQFKAGQFIMMQVPDPEKGKPAQRAYSIASHQEQPEQIKLVIKVYEHGKASDFVKTLAGGEDLKVSGPFGRHFFILPAPPQVIFLCTGAGISQHMSYLLSHGEAMKNSHVKMLLGVWNKDEVFYEKELTDIKKVIPKFDYEFVLDKADPTWKGKTGFVTQYFHELPLKENDTLIYLCGNPNMIKSAKEILADQFQFPADRIIAEAFN